METRSDLAFKWLCYGVLTLLAVAVQALVLQRIRLWGVVPFIPPILCALAASFEPGTQGFAYSLVFGVLCDLALLGPLPCFYTVTFVLTAVAAAWVSTKVLNAGFISTTVMTLCAFVLADLLRAVVLLDRGTATLWDVLLYGGEELLLSLPFALLLYPAFSRVHRHFHQFD